MNKRQRRKFEKRMAALGKIPRYVNRRIAAYGSRWPHDKIWFEDGPWNKEPDSATWEDKESGYLCAIRRNELCTLTGYVMIPADHPCYGKDLDEAPDIRVHGGITYANSILGAAKTSIGWWFGFDCAAGHDYAPKRRDIARLAKELDKNCDTTETAMPFKRTYRSFNYVKEQVTKLAKQLKQFENAAAA